ncbi:hypothetical protein GCM10007108_08920 [Thermogymnomonas acidicola]|uniref:Prephenate dehydratase n=1 Tax=Thermogymnomonas acidicola TaxID=399579 RepID=A0AA37BRR1_9ARCH|nr:prephenate dehydratase [Thermogymnomonas acidicola]GGM73141.1 hypothetical protein GCM10007108_08920 [Thermogymnomonas acidicola]
METKGAGVRVSCLGPEGTWSEFAVRSMFSRAEIAFCRGFREAIELAEAGSTEYCVLPVENSIEGPVTPVLDALTSTGLRIVAEKIVSVRQALLAVGTDIRRVVSHPQALAQCEGRIRAMFPNAEIISVSSTSAGAIEAANREDTAVVGPPWLAQKYGLRVIAQDMSDYRFNLTRFICLGRGRPPRTGRDKTSLTLVLRDDGPGSLHRLLTPFAERLINLSMVVSRPEKEKPWRYRFFFDLHGHEDDSAVRSALSDISSMVTEMKVIGSYPREDWPQTDA